MPAAVNSYKLYNLSGLAKTVDFGKDSARISNIDNDHFEFQNQDSTALVNAQGADPRTGNEGLQDFLTRNYFESHAGSVNVTLQPPADGSFAGGAVSTWVPGSTTVSTACDDLNSILGKLVPSKPDNLSSKTITATGGSTQLICTGATNNAGGSLPSAGSSVYTIFSPNFTSSLATGGTTGTYCFDGSAGTLSAIINGSVNGTITFTNSLNAGINQQNGDLLVTDDNWYPISQPNFWQSFQAKVNGTSIPVGYNSAKLSHSTTGNTNVVNWLYDNVASYPTVSSVSYSEGTNSGYRYSSGVAHLTTGNTININATLANLTGQTYTTSTVFTMTTSHNAGTSTLTATQLGTGLSFPLSANLANQTISSRVLTLGSSNIFATDNIVTSATNVRGTSSPTQASGSNLLVWTGTTTGSAGSPVMERSVYNTASSNAGVRVLLNDSSDTPNDGITAETNLLSGGSNYFNSNSVNLITNQYEASIVAGTLKYDVTNYSTGYIPAGPNLNVSGRTGASAEYATFYIKGTGISSFKVSITGTYAGIFIKLPNFNFSAAGLTKGSAYDASNGWMNLMQAAPGSGMPGISTNSMGCASGQIATGNSGTFTCTFNNGSTTYSADNVVLIRIKLTAGQSITSLSLLA